MICVYRFALCRMVLLLGIGGFLALPAAHAAPRDYQPRMSWLDNGAIRVGVDLNVGGAITWLSRSKLI